VTPLEALLRGRIKCEGPVPVSDFMAIALGDPDHGYYRKSDPLGANGDFITAPEISQVFGELIGLWCAIGWQQAGAPAAVKLVELGPGRGTLMADVLRAARTVPAFIDACDIHLVETSPALRACQETALTGHNVTWHDTLEPVPNGPSLIIANEFFDALPIDQYERTDTGWRIRCVGIDPADDSLCYVTGDAINFKGPDFPVAVDAAPVGSLFETCPAGLTLATTLGQRMADDGIATLIIDYGHGRSGAGETLQAVRNHKSCGVLTDPGDSDLTAHVDFAALASRAGRSGARIVGPIPQGAFLTALGIEARTDQLAANADQDTASLLRSGCRRLIGADSMGMLFKVMALTNQTVGLPAGFDSLAQ
jgi:NADH dehydrogenase [ubiquinone] 1 alpha subcomplex assembly factor 7